MLGDISSPVTATEVIVKSESFLEKVLLKQDFEGWTGVQQGHDAWAGILDKKMGFQSYEDFSSEINVSEVSSNICLIFIFSD